MSMSGYVAHISTTEYVSICCIVLLAVLLYIFNYIEVRQEGVLRRVRVYAYIPRNIT
jgi:hypothetical protein